MYLEDVLETVNDKFTLPAKIKGKTGRTKENEKKTRWKEKTLGVERKRKENLKGKKTHFEDI